MRALMNLAIEPALRLFEVSTLVVITPSSQAVKIGRASCRERV